MEAPCAVCCAGIANVRMPPAAPAWFSALDLIAAYLPMAWRAHRLVVRG